MWTCVPVRILITAVDAGAHFGWTSYSAIKALTALTELQFAHCSGALPLAWLTGMVRLRRLYLKGNGALSSQMIGLEGGPALLPAVAEGLTDLYLGLCAFLSDDGASLPLPAAVRRAVKE
jgi:hypothetical protein